MQEYMQRIAGKIVGSKPDLEDTILDQSEA
jgi:hypothetical protein